MGNLSQGLWGKGELTVSTTLPIIQVAVGAILISFSAIFTKLAETDPIATGFYRMFFGGLLLAIILLITRQKFWETKRLFLLICGCALFFSVDIILWHTSIFYIGPGLATVLVNIQVFFLVLFGAIFLKDKISWKTNVSLVMAGLGLYLIFGLHWYQSDHLFRVGTILVVIAALFYALYILLLKRVQETARCLSPISTLTIISLVCALFVGMKGVFSGISFAIPNVQTFIVLVVYAACGQVLGWFLIVKGLPKVKVSQVGFLLLLQPLLAYVWDVLFFQKPVGFLELIGVAILLASIYLATLARATAQK